MDPVSEKKILTGLGKNLRQGMTLVIISHALKNITPADRILFLDHGSVAEQGTHEELIRHRGGYFQYWNKPEAFLNHTEK